MPVEKVMARRCSLTHTSGFLLQSTTDFSLQSCQHPPIFSKHQNVRAIELVYSVTTTLLKTEPCNVQELSNGMSSLEPSTKQRCSPRSAAAARPLGNTLQPLAVQRRGGREPGAPWLSPRIPRVHGSFQRAQTHITYTAGLQAYCGSASVCCRHLNASLSSSDVCKMYAKIPLFFFFCDGKHVLEKEEKKKFYSQDALIADN